MSNSLFRLFLWAKLAQGPLTNWVQSNLPNGSTGLPSSTSFREKFLHLPPGPEREKFIYQEIIKRGPPKNLVPVSVPGPNGTKITYQVMPDYVQIEGVRVPMTPVTAQKVADYFHMILPSDKMSQQIYQASDTKIRATPLSNSGYVGKDGKYYSGTEVANRRINQSDAALEYNDLTEKELQKIRQSGKNPTLVAGHGKDILSATQDTKTPHMGGWAGSDGKPLQPYTNAHKNEGANHSEYGLYTRLVGGEVQVTDPNGQVRHLSWDEAFQNPELAKLLTTQPGLKKYQE